MTIELRIPVVNITVNQDHRLIELINNLTKNQERIMVTIDTLVADFAKYKTDVAAKLAELKAELGAVPAAVQAKIDALDAAVLEADAEVAPVAPVTPVPEPNVP